MMVMGDKRRLAIRFLLFLILAILAAGFQTSFWFHLFKGMPPPVLWLTLIMYVTVYRDMVEGLISVFILGAALSVFTAMPEGILVLLAVGLFFSGRFVKTRIFWPGTSYFVMIVAGSIPLYYIFHWLLSLYFEENPVAGIPVLMMIVQLVSTSIAAIFIYPLLTWIDEFMKEDNKEGWSLN